MLRVITLNLNGIRAAARKSLFAWLARQKADVFCAQELKAQSPDMDQAMLACGALCGHFHYAEKKGYSGVALYSKREPDRVVEGLGVREFDAEGRYLRADFGKLSVISVYLPSGSSGAHRQAMKFRFMDVFYPHLKALRLEKREFILCGDWNIAQKEIDLKNWRGNRKNSGFLPEERAWLTKVFDELGWVDVYRRLHPDTTDASYTWWSHRGQAWAKNVGWRIDYQIATPGIAARAVRTKIYKEERFSDHAPLTIDYDYVPD
ncbi:MAG TPA: exodeoxyribonuclease III [Burkholderiales bacterium]|nr:exodeoxyribonuclease III [Burkholderiales bacterium]